MKFLKTLVLLFVSNSVFASNIEQVSEDLLTSYVKKEFLVQLKEHWKDELKGDSWDEISKQLDLAQYNSFLDSVQHAVFESSDKFDEEQAWHLVKTFTVFYAKKVVNELLEEVSLDLATTEKTPLEITKILTEELIKAQQHQSYKLKSSRVQKKLSYYLNENQLKNLVSESQK